jgi:hypothetical protein
MPAASPKYKLWITALSRDYISGGKSIASPTNGLNEFTVHRMGVLQRFPKTANTHVNRTRIHTGIIAPNALEYLFARMSSLWMRHKKLQ